MPLINITLNRIELSRLMLQSPATKSDGGFQSLLVKLQDKVDLATGRIILSAKDIEKIFRYTWKYRNGGWQKRLLYIFGRTIPFLAMWAYYG